MSNMLLGHVGDLRNHPIRYLITKGLQISINSGHPGLFDYDDVCMDYMAVYLAWGLSIRDLKKITLNGIVHSSIKEDEKVKLREGLFKEKWQEFIQFVIEKYNNEFI